ncbi:MAG TPA: hypothetical protein VK466_15465 [Terriglobales bacterium]|nr:hypothetical protein [Terriglobales bacterium]
MKTQSPASVACCAALLIVTAPLMARAASKTLLLKDAEPQYAKQLCWAAADVLAVNQFYPICPTSTPTASPALFPTSQALEAANNRLARAGAGSLSDFLPTCELNIGNCNFADDLWDSPDLHLHGLTGKKGFTGAPSTTGDNNVGLRWEAAKQEIDAGRPFLFIWDYPEDDASSLPVGKHQLVATGYSDERDSSGTQYLQIWDPWPVPLGLVLPTSVPACGPAPGVPVTPEHSRWVYFSTYTGPGNDMGVTVTALHEYDQWHLARVAPDAPVVTVDGGPPPPAPPPFHPQPPSGALPQVSFAKALSAALPQSRQLDLQVSGAAPRTLGVPFPIVGLGFRKLLRAADDPTALLAGTTSAILFPVVSHGEVVDAFLMLFMEGRWQRGGYANIEITQRLVKFRARYTTQEHPLGSFYMVSVPGEVAFFAAYGKGKKAILIPTSTDPSIDAVAGKAVPAGPQLKKLVSAIQQDLQLYPNRARDSPRPAQ